MDLTKIIVISSLILFGLLLILFAIIYTRRSAKAVRYSQTNLTDKELLEFINSQPDKMVNSKVLMDRFGLTKFESGSRLRHLMHYGLLRMLRSRKWYASILYTCKIY